MSGTLVRCASPSGPIISVRCAYLLSYRGLVDVDAGWHQATKAASAQLDFQLDSYHHPPDHRKFSVTALFLLRIIMRLLNVQSRNFEEFMGDNVPPCAIHSHKLGR